MNVYLVVGAVEAGFVNLLISCSGASAVEADTTS
jgi:hypothetical protein